MKLLRDYHGGEKTALQLPSILILNGTRSIETFFKKINVLRCPEILMDG